MKSTDDSQPPGLTRSDLHTAPEPAPLQIILLPGSSQLNLRRINISKQNQYPSHFPTSFLHFTTVLFHWRVSADQEPKCVDNLSVSAHSLHPWPAPVWEEPRVRQELASLTQVMAPTLTLTSLGLLALQAAGNINIINTITIIIKTNTNYK